MKAEYITRQSHNLAELTADCSRLLAEGWREAGGINAVVVETRAFDARSTVASSVLYTQALVWIPDPHSTASTTRVPDNEMPKYGSAAIPKNLIDACRIE